MTDKILYNKNGLPLVLNNNIHYQYDKTDHKWLLKNNLTPYPEQDNIDLRKSFYNTVDNSPIFKNKTLTQIGSEVSVKFKKQTSTYLLESIQVDANNKIICACLVSQFYFNEYEENRNEFYDYKYNDEYYDKLGISKKLKTILKREWTINKNNSNPKIVVDRYKKDVIFVIKVTKIYQAMIELFSFNRYHLNGHANKAIKIKFK